jgi:hypothetical protein
MSNFYQDVIQPAPQFLSPNRCADSALIEPSTRTAIQSIISAAKAEMGLDLMLWEGYRSQPRQSALFTQRVTQLKTVGVHHYGLAGDIVKVISGEPSWKGDFSFLGPLAKRFGLIWGGDWGTPNQPHSFRDFDHVQRCSVADQIKLFAGNWYPDENYDPYSEAA